ncbi:hypothetical protein Bca101_095211 [Brassica carinata]
MKIFAALHGLGQEYEPIKTSVEGSMEIKSSPTFEDITSRLKSFDDRLQSYTSSSTELSPHLAFNTTRSSNFTWKSSGVSNLWQNGSCCSSLLAPFQQQLSG